MTDGLGSDGSDRIMAVERLQFIDRSTALDLDGNEHGGQAAQILRALFAAGALKHSMYAGYAVTLLDQGMGYSDLVGFALQTPVFWANTGGSVVQHAIDAFVKTVYKNVVAQAPSALDLSYFVGLLDSGAFSQAALGVLACQTALNTGSTDLVGCNSPTNPVLDDQYSVGLSLELTSSTLKAAGSKAPPTHALRCSCSGWLGSRSASRNSS